MDKQVQRNSVASTVPRTCAQLGHELMNLSWLLSTRTIRPLYRLLQPVHRFRLSHGARYQTTARTSNSAPLLEGDPSGTGKTWLLEPTEEQRASLFASALSLPDAVARLLAQRAESLEQAQAFLNPSIRRSLPDPFLMTGMPEAVDRLMGAIRNKELICIFGDYDVDGATSSALLYRYLTDPAINARVVVYIPHRHKEGFGPNLPALKKLRSVGVSLVVTCDCGTTSHDVLRAAQQELEMDVIVVDHHLPDTTHDAENALPPSVAVINPNRPDEHPAIRQELKDSCAVAMSFMLCTALNRRLKQLGFFEAPPTPTVAERVQLGQALCINLAQVQRKPRVDVFSVDEDGKTTLVPEHEKQGLTRGKLKQKRAEKLQQLAAVAQSLNTGVPDLPVHERQFTTDPTPPPYAEGSIADDALQPGSTADSEPKKDSAVRRVPNLYRHLDLVALGTLCDVMPLVGINRAFVAEGLKVMNASNKPAFAALQQQVKYSTDTIDAWDLGFALGPRINAGGRMGEQPDLGSRLLRTQDRNEAQELAKLLNDLNELRKVREQAVLEEAQKDIDLSHRAVVVTGREWHGGVIGIVAGRLAQRFGRPAIALSVDSEGVAKGSGRSVGNVNLGQLVFDAVQQGLLIQGGGHAMAVGLSLHATRIPEFIQFLDERLRDVEMKPTLRCDAKLTLSQANIRLYRSLQVLGPFGNGNPWFKFLFENVSLHQVQVLKQKHIKAMLTDEQGSSVPAIAFSTVDTKLGQQLQAAATPGSKWHVVGTLEEDTFRGDAVMIHIEDIAPAQGN